jgi:hypothetical protein
MALLVQSLLLLLLLSMVGGGEGTIAGPAAAIAEAVAAS